ncbi:MAG: DUF488 domain-containing protein [Candidatus Hydrogenedentes bacterium]|nr:DUF488 domain-containing protein [Candidatus Hydrogenedentota bacterium]MBI3118599.1 DUF488 domain-containing protein [Candidatus Hydrogenedentota bacterium]
MKLFSIGFTQKSAEQFFGLLQDAGVKRVVDVRLNNTSQIAGFAKSRDLQYFLRAVAGIDYVHLPVFAPTQEILDDYKKKKGAWDAYEREFAHLIAARHMAEAGARELRDGDCLLCSEHTPDQCHRRLVAEHLQAHLPDVEVIHL